MKKPTSKSASGTQKTSSPSGTSAKTVGTENQPLIFEESNFGFVLARAKQQTPEQARLAMIRAGILTSTGQLSEHYVVHPKAKRIAKPRKKSKA